MEIKETKEITISNIPKNQKETVEDIVLKKYLISEITKDFDGSYFIKAFKPLEKTTTTDIDNIEDFI